MSGIWFLFHNSEYVAEIPKEAFLFCVVVPKLLLNKASINIQNFSMISQFLNIKEVLEMHVKDADKF